MSFCGNSLRLNGLCLRLAKKTLVDNFVDTIRKYGVQWKLDYGDVDVDAFGRWVYENPLRCPGLRLSYEMYHELSANLGDSPKDSDIPDFAHINAIPYVDAATLDRRMLHYFRRVVSKLRTLKCFDCLRRLCLS